jgi:hypothetical protein
MVGLLSSLALGCSGDGFHLENTNHNGNQNNQNNSSLECGNGVAEAPEPCDGADLAGKSCLSLGQGYTGGSLACTGNCMLDASGCVVLIDCGDGIIGAGEACDGTNLGQETCTTLGAGFTGGALACRSDCSAYDTSGCTGGSLCGNGVVEGSEVCDGTNLDGETCVSQGFDGGALACAAGCQTFVTTGCTSAGCGNGAVDAGEVCDGAELDGQTCATIGQGFTGGALACDGSCVAWDTTGCTPACEATWLGVWAGTPIEETVDTCSGVSDYGDQAIGCVGGAAPGEEVLYALTLAAGDQVTVENTPAPGVDGVLYVLTGCNDTAGQSCVGGADRFGDGAPERVLLENPGPGPVTYFIVVDNFVAGECGTSTLRIEPTGCGDGVVSGGELCDGDALAGNNCTTIGMGFTGGNLHCSGTCDAWATQSCTGASQTCGNDTAEGNEICDGDDLRGQTCLTLGLSAGALACRLSCNAWDTSGCTAQCGATELGTWAGNAITRSGTTCDGGMAYSTPPAPAGCTGYVANGYEVVYGLILPAGAAVSVTYRAQSDNALYVLTDCEDTMATTCVVGADANSQPPYVESVALSNSGLGPVHYYLVLDNYSQHVCSDYTLEISP